MYLSRWYISQFFDKRYSNDAPHTIGSVSYPTKLSLPLDGFALRWIQKCIGAKPLGPTAFIEAPFFSIYKYKYFYMNVNIYRCIIISIYKGTVPLSMSNFKTL